MLLPPSRTQQGPRRRTGEETTLSGSMQYNIGSIGRQSLPAKSSRPFWGPLLGEALGPTHMAEATGVQTNTHTHRPLA